MIADGKKQNPTDVETENSKNTGGEVTSTPIPINVGGEVINIERKTSSTKKSEGGEIGVSSQSERGFTKIAKLLQIESVGNDVIVDKPKNPPTVQKNNIDKTGILLEDVGEKKTPVRNPLFAARILEQEQKPFRPEVKNHIIVEGSTKKYTEPKIKRIRTYQEDVANTLKNEQTSAVQMVLAEHKKRERRKKDKSPTTKKNLTFIILSILLVVTGIIALSAVAFYIIKKVRVPTTQTPIEIISPIFSETKKEIDVTGFSKATLIETIQDEILNINIRLDFIEYLYFTENISRIDKRPDVKVLITPQRFFEIINTKMQNSLLRSFGSSFMFGVYSFNGNQPFIILDTKFFESTFIGMLKWEPYMASEILPLFDIKISPNISDKKFEDTVVKNRDLRVLRDDEENIILLYSFFNRNTLIIATDTKTLDEIITRLNRPKKNSDIFK